MLTGDKLSTAEKLVQFAQDCGSQDNITVIVVFFDDSCSPAVSPSRFTRRIMNPSSDTRHKRARRSRLSLPEGAQSTDRKHRSQSSISPLFCKHQ